MSHKAHLLVFTPITPGGLQADTVKSVVGQQFAGEITWQIGRCNPFPPPDMRNVLAQYAMGRELFLRGPYDAMVTVEQDMTLPPHALETLWQDGAAVVYGTYMLRHGIPVVNALKYEGKGNLGMSLSLYSGAWPQARKAGRQEVSGVGFGCTLIRRSVLEAIPFQADSAGDAPDMPFARDCLRLGIEQFARFDVACGHVHEGHTLKVDGDSDAVKVMVMRSVNVLIDGNSAKLSAGKTVTLATEQAMQLAQWGYVAVAFS